MWSNLRAVPTNLLHRVEQFTQPKRTTFVLGRRNVPKLNRLGASYPKKLRRHEFYYELIRDTNAKVKPPIEVVLTADVPGVGMRGETVSMNIFNAYKDLLLPKLAVYPDSPEAQRIQKVFEEKTYSSKYSKIVENYLSSQPLQIFMSNETPWTLKPWHVKCALRKIGILTEEECITIPKEISGPDDQLENKDFIIRLTMNKTEVFPVRCRIYHWSSSEPLLNHKECDVFSQSEALFPDEQKAINQMIKIEEDIRRSRRIKGEIADKKKEK